MFNSILIRRRTTGSTGGPATLSGGELAYNEVDDTLYYGRQVDGVVLPIAGPGAFVSRTLTQDVSGTKTFWNTTIFEDDVTINANTLANGDLTITGNLSVLGEVTSIETSTSVASAFSVTNVGSQTALTVTQTGPQNVAEFYDDSAIALAVVDGGNVGIGTLTPNEKLTVNGNLSANGDVFVNTVKLADASNGLGLSIYNSSNAETFLIGTWFGESSIIGKTSNTNLYGVDKITLSNLTGGFPGNGLSEVLIKSAQTNVTGALSAAGSVEFNSTLAVSGTSTFGDDMTVIDKVTTQTANFAPGMTGAAIVADAANARLRIDDGGTTSSLMDITPGNITANANAQGLTLSTLADLGAGIKFTPAVGSHTNVTQGNLNGNGLNSINDFIIDGGTF
jgi:hypothetical protein